MLPLSLIPKTTKTKQSLQTFLPSGRGGTGDKMSRNWSSEVRGGRHGSRGVRATWSDKVGGEAWLVPDWGLGLKIASEKPKAGAAQWTRGMVVGSQGEAQLTMVTGEFSQGDGG